MSAAKFNVCMDVCRPWVSDPQPIKSVILSLPKEKALTKSDSIRRPLLKFLIETVKREHPNSSKNLDQLTEDLNKTESGDEISGVDSGVDECF